MSQPSTNLVDLAPELLIQIAKDITTFSELSAFCRAHPYIHHVLATYEFEICEPIAEKEFNSRIRPDVYKLLATQGALQRSLSQTVSTGPLALPVTKTGILKGGTRVGIAEAAQLESYKARLEAWKPVYLAELKAHPNGVGNPFPYVAFFHQNPFSGAELTPNIHFRIERAYFRFWTIILSRVEEEQQFTAKMLARPLDNRRVEYFHWSADHIKRFLDCPREKAHLYSMYEWIKTIPEICIPSDEAGEEMWDVIMVGDFNYDVQGGMGAEVIPVPRLRIVHSPPGTFESVEEGSVVLGERILISAERLRGLWVLDLHRSLWRTRYM